MKTWEKIKAEQKVLEFINKNEDLFGDMINGDTSDCAISILSQVYNATKDGCTSGTEEELDVDFFYSHNGNNEPICWFSANELCDIMGIEPMCLI